MEQKEITVNNYRENLYIIDDGGVRCFLFTGADEAVLIDTGMPDSGFVKKAREITGLPLKVLLTHADIDHAGGLGECSEVWVHPADAEMIKTDIIKHDLTEGDVISVAGYELEVVHIPGHTYGSVGFLDRKSGLFIIGDSVQRRGPIFMFGEARNVGLYIESLKKLQAMKGQYKEFLPGHHDYPVGEAELDHCLEDAQALLDGKLDHTVRPCCFPGFSADLYSGKNTLFLYSK